jgi:hypothetical protein
MQLPLARPQTRTREFVLVASGACYFRMAHLERAASRLIL